MVNKKQCNTQVKGIFINNVVVQFNVRNDSLKKCYTG